MIHCQRCGDFRITSEAADVWAEVRTDRDAAKVSYHLWKMRAGGSRPSLNTDLLRQLLSRSELPTPLEQADNLVLIFGDESVGVAGQTVQFDGRQLEKISARAGCGDSRNVFFLLKQLEESGLFAAQHTLGVARGALTLRGWERYEHLKRAKVDSLRAFMAMQFNDPVLDRLVIDYFKPAVAATGFTLWRLDEAPEAGLIDNRLRVEIRRSRFLIADLTHANRGAYWEAGFAEGLGLPVIYTCRRDVLEGRVAEARVHFDTRNCQIVPWAESANEIGKAVAMLKATIRNTLPAEAILGD